jgi:hypothetical protein
MNRLKHIYIILATLIVVSACTEDYDLINVDGAPEYCIDAFITANSNYNSIRISKIVKGFNTDELSSGLETLPENIAVQNARVVLRYDNKQIEFKITKPQHNNKFVGYGYYATSDIIEVKENTKYTLEVFIDGKTYVAESKLVKGPENMTAKLKKTKLEIQKDDAYVPHVSFTDPDKNNTNYYITHMSDNLFDSYQMTVGSSRNWAISILTDKYLQHNIVDLKFPFGTSPTGTSWYPSHETDVTVTLFSVDKMTYDYFNVLITQIKNNGGAYSQSPGSPITNFKGGAVGYFVLADVTQAIAKVNN